MTNTPRTEAVRRWPRLLRSATQNHHCRALLALMAAAWLVQLGTWEGILSRSMGGALSSDGSCFVWHFWHLKEALLGRRELMFSDQFFYPVGLHLIHQDWAPLAGLLALPFQVLGPVPAHNCELFVALVLCGYFTYLLAHHLCRHSGYALLAGFIFAFCEFRLSKAAGHTSQANQQFLPLYLYWLVRFADQRLLRFAAWGGVSLVLATFCSPYQAVYAALLTLCFFGYRLLAATTDRARWSLLGQELRTIAGFCSVAAAIAAVLISPVLLTQWELIRDGEATVSSVASSRIANPSLCLDLLSFVLSPHTKLAVAVLSVEGRTGFVGYSVLVLFVASVVGLRARPVAGVWVFTASVFFWLALGGFVVVGGQVIARLPYSGLMQALPIVRGASVPARFVSMVALCVGLSIAVSLSAWDKMQLARGAVRMARWTTFCLVAIPCLELCLVSARRRFEWNAGAPSVTFPEAFSEMAANGPGLTVLYVPPVWETNLRILGPGLFPRRRFADATRHGCRISDGIGDVTPDETLEYFQRLPLMRELILPGRTAQLSRFSPLLDSLREDARYVASQLGIRYVIFDREISVAGGDADGRLRRSYREQTAQYLQSVLRLEEVARDSLASYWRVAEALDGPPAVVEFAHEGSLVHLGPGWQRVGTDQQWYARRPIRSGRAGVLYLSVPPDTTGIAVTARCRPDPCTVEMTLNGHSVGTLDLSQSWARHRFPLEAPHAPGLGRFRLKIGRSRMLQGPFPVGRTGVRCPVPVRVSSYGLPVGNRASVLVDSVEQAPNLRGHNVVVIDPVEGGVIESQAFDLVEDRSGAEGARMVAFIGRIPRGMVVVDSVKDEGSLNFTPDARSALQSIGAQADLSGRFRHSFAVVGVKGARPGTAAEELSAQPVQISLEQGIDVLSVEFQAATPTGRGPQDSHPGSAPVLPGDADASEPPGMHRHAAP
jgi:hypothetical protein